MRVFYNDKQVWAARLLEEHAPKMPTRAEMNGQSAQDPVSVALFFNVMMELFLKHFLGVDRTCPKGHPDGVASEFFRGLFGVVQAYHGAVETQGRGGLHAHMHVWLKHPMTAHVLDKLRRGLFDDDLRQRLEEWQEAVRWKVGSLQFEGVEEIGRQLKIPKAHVAPLPFSSKQQQQTRTRGIKEEFQDEVEDGPQGATEPWATAPMQGCARFEPLVPTREEADHPELDPHQYVGGRIGGPVEEEKDVHKKAMTGACVCLNPQYRRKPPFVVHRADGQAVMLAQGVAAKEDARRWKYEFFRDARKNIIRSHLHKCKPTCWKLSRDGDDKSIVRVCRFHFQHVYQVTRYTRFAPSQKLCATRPLKRFTNVDNWNKRDTNKWLRKGKKLVPPRLKGVKKTSEGRLIKFSSRLKEWPAYGEYREDELDHIPDVRDDEYSRTYGRGGQCACLRAHPLPSSTTCCGVVCFRCNLDLQCHDCLPIPDEIRKRGPSRKDAVKKVAADGGDAEAVGDEQGPPANEAVEVEVEKVPLCGGGRLDEEFCGDCDDEEDFDHRVGEEAAFIEPCGPDEPGEEEEEEMAQPAEANSDDVAAVDKQLIDEVEGWVHAYERCHLQAHNVAHYTGDYSTKFAERVGSLVPALAQGMTNLVAGWGSMSRPKPEDAEGVKEVDAYVNKRTRREAGGTVRPGESWDQLVDRGRQLLIRLQTSANRTIVKKLTEMDFQMLFNHECFLSHRTWTIFCKKPVAFAYRAKERRKRWYLRQNHLDLDGFTPDYGNVAAGDDEDEEQADDDVADVGFLRAFVEQPDEPENKERADGGARGTLDDFLRRGPSPPDQNTTAGRGAVDAEAPGYPLNGVEQTSCSGSKIWSRRVL